MNDIDLLEEAYKETMKDETKRKAHYTDKGRPGYFCKLCVHFKKKVKSPNGDEFYCNLLKIYVGPNGLCSEFKTTSAVRSKNSIVNVKPDTLTGGPTSNKSPATQGNDMHSDPQVGQGPV